ncbi:MAG: ribonuclease III [Gammaproteobacteria bacterium]|nr:ribonuclease III [Gammaproteobacteria bacterium]
MKNNQAQQFCKDHNLQQLDQGLLRQAFTHSSAGKPNNERLEFLGDAVLGCVIAELLFQALPNAKEHYLTRLRAHLVNKQSLSILAESLNFSDMVILGQGERSTGGKHRRSILADALEAVIGAVHLDMGYQAVTDFVRAIFTDMLNDLPTEEDLKAPKTRLQEWLQKRGQPIPEYAIVDETGKAHAKTFTVEAKIEIKNKARTESFSQQARGSSRRAAEQQAANDLLEQIRQNL